MHDNIMLKSDNDMYLLILIYSQAEFESMYGLRGHEHSNCFVTS